MAKLIIAGTGLSGLIGSRFQALYQDKYDFVNLDLTTGVDITDPISVEIAIEKSHADAVIHLAAFTDVNQAFEQAGNQDGICYKVNVIGTKNLAKSCNKHRLYLIHISTDYVFDGTKSEPYVESDIPHPIEWYGETKYMAEQIVTSELPQSVILRPAYPYQSNPSRPDFLAKIITHLTNNTLPPAFTDHIITPTFADDWAKVFDYCIANRPTGLYHATGSSWHSDFEIAEIVKKTFDLPGLVKPGSLREFQKTIKRPYQPTMKVSNQKLTRDFDLHLATFEEGLQIIKSQLAI